MAKSSKQTKEWQRLGLLAVVCLGLWGLGCVTAYAGEELTKKEIRSYRKEYMALFNEMVGGLFQEEQFYSHGFSRGYPQGHAWAIKEESLGRRFEGRSLELVRATYNPLTESSLLCGDLRQIADEVRTRKTISPATDRQLDDMECNLLLGDTGKKIEAVLPGVNKYVGYMLRLGLERTPSYSHPALAKTVSVIWMLYQVPENDTHIPAIYRAKGQTLRLGIVADGSALVLQKRATKAVFRDREIASNGGDQIVSLR